MRKGQKSKVPAWHAFLRLKIINIEKNVSVNSPRTRRKIRQRIKAKEEKEESEQWKEEDEEEAAAEEFYKKNKKKRNMRV